MEILSIVLSVTFVAFAAVRFGWHPFYLLLGMSLFLGFFLFRNPDEVMPAVGAGFGNMLERIAFIIIFGALLGNLLFKAGAMDRIAKAIFSGWLLRFPSLAMGLVGLVVGIPVFCDAGYVVLSHIPRSILARPRQKILMSIMLAAGLYLSHTLIPPTPGPMAALGALNMVQETGRLMLWGSGIGLLTLLMLYLWLSGRFGVSQINLPEKGPKKSVAGLLLALIPLILPLLLIGIGSIGLTSSSAHSVTLSVISQPAVALMIACIIACAIYFKKLRNSFKTIASKTLDQAAPILLLTGAGGALGNVIASADFMIELQKQDDWLGSGYVLILGAYTAAFLIKSIQGSSTGAIVITAAILTPASSQFAGSNAGILVVLAIGAGALAVSHTNDSYFWVIAKFEDWNTRQALKYWSLPSLLVSLSAMLIITLAYFVLPWIS